MTSLEGYFSAWGNYPFKFGKLITCKTVKEIQSFLLQKKPFIPVGNFKSYGDAALNNSMLKFDPTKTIKIDPHNQTAFVSANVLIGELIKYSVPLGFFPAVVPGTKFITIGGAIAADIHGKNHHKDGCFSEHLISFEIITKNGNKINCDKKKTPELWKSTCGGMGLTGVIVSAKLKLKKINSSMIHQTTINADSIEELFNLFEENSKDPFSVAWIDCTEKSDKLGRGIYLSGKFSNDTASRKYKTYSQQNLSIPILMPKFLVNWITIKVFNILYYTILKYSKGKRLVPFDKFFFPLDKIKNWNRIYGRSGFVQYQFVLPKKYSLDGIKTILSIIRNSGEKSTLAVLKLFGNQNRNYLSFPMEGYTLALDFKNTPKIPKLLSELDEVVRRFNGRIYLAKDSRSKKQVVLSGYPKIQNFKNQFFDQKSFSSLQSQRLFG